MSIDQVEAYIKSKGWSPEDKTDCSLTATERGSGNGTDCELDPFVVSQAKEMRREIKKRWPESKCGLEAVDEWVIIEVSFPRKKERVGA